MNMFCSTSRCRQELWLHQRVPAQQRNVAPHPAHAPQRPLQDGVLRPAHRQLSPLRPAAEAGHVPCPAVGPTPPSPGPLRITSATTVLFYWDWRSLKGTVWNPLFIVVCWWLWVTVSFYFFGGSFCTTRDGSVGKDGLLTPFLYVL